MEMVHILGHIVELILHSSRFGFLVGSSMKTIQLEMGCIQRIAQFLVDNSNKKHMEMVLHQRSNCLLKVHSSKVQFELVHSNQSKQLEMESIQQTIQSLVSNSSMKHMEMVLLLGQMFELLLHSSKARCLGHSNSLSRLLEMGCTQHIVQFLVSNSCIRRMEMVRNQHSNRLLKVHSSRVQFELVHSIQSKQLGMESIQQTIQSLVSNSSMKHMEMVLLLGQMFELILHSSKGRFLGHSNMKPRLLELVSKLDRFQFLEHSSNMR